MNAGEISAVDPLVRSALLGTTAARIFVTAMVCAQRRHASLQDKIAIWIQLLKSAARYTFYIICTGDDCLDVQTSVWTNGGSVDEETSCALAQTSISISGNVNQNLACCFTEGQHCNDDSQCCDGHRCVCANDAYGIQLTGTSKKCRKDSCSAEGKAATDEHCTSSSDCCGHHTVTKPQCLGHFWTQLLR